MVRRVDAARPRGSGLLALGFAALFVTTASAASPGAGPVPPLASLEGRVLSEGGEPVSGGFVTLLRGHPQYAVTVYTDREGRFRFPRVPAGTWRLRFRRVGWQDRVLDEVVVPREPGSGELVVHAVRETDPLDVAAQLPANRWFALVLERLEDERDREEVVRQCTYCHQQGNWATRVVRDREEWRKVLDLMGRMGGILRRDLRERLPEILNAAYDPDVAVPRLTAGMDGPDFFPDPPPEALTAVIEEWQLGLESSMQHDVMVHPDGRVYSVDMGHDRLYRLDPSVPGGLRESFPIPRDDLPLGGVFGTLTRPLPSNYDTHVGPHSLQTAPDGSIWITLAIGNQLARFDPRDASWQKFTLEDGFYPHTLRFDARGRIWYTVAASNHVGMLDPASGEHRQIRLPARSFRQAVALRMLPLFLWLGRRFDLGGMATAGEGMDMPVPYGIDVAPDGGVWFSQLNEHRIGRIDPDTFEVEVLDTPFPGPRRLRFDAEGRLWIPSFSSSSIARFDPATREFERFELPVEPRGSETPYALHVNRRTGEVWICGTESDSLIRFEPEIRRFTIYPLPTRVTYTREIDFDAQGRVWTSNSNAPTWQIESGFPRVIRLDPGAGAGHIAAADRSLP